MAKAKKKSPESLPVPANNGFRLQLKQLVTNKVKRFKDDIAKRSGTSDITDSWLYERLKGLLQSSGYIACETCGIAMTWDAITIDHKIPRSFNKIYRGNIHSIDNLNIVCPACNSLKGQRTLQEFIQILMARNAEILSLREQYKSSTQPPIIAPLYPDIGLGQKIFGPDRSYKKVKK